MFTGIYVNAQDYRFGKVSVEEVAQKQHPVDPDAHAAILNRELKTEFAYSSNDGFYLITNVLERVKIYDKEGFDWANVRVKLYQGARGSDEELSGLKGVTYTLDSNGDLMETKLRSDGQFEEKVSDYLVEEKFTMPNVSEGCVIEYRYKVTSPFITNINTFRLQEKIPVDHVEMLFFSPEYFNFKTHKRGWVPVNIKETQVDRSYSYGELKREVLLTNVPAMVEEGYAGNIDNYAASLKFELSYIQYPNGSTKDFATSWETVSKTINESGSFGDELKQKNYFEEDIDALLSGVSDKNEKIAKVFNFVKAKMTWNRFNGYYATGVKDAYKKSTGNVGDINLMLTAMLRYAGINANPVILSTKDNGIPIFPTRDGFNYVVAGVEVLDDVLLLDATNKNAEINVLEKKLLNWQGRVIRSEGSSNWVSLVPETYATESTMISAEITPERAIVGDSRNRYSAHYALEYRQKYSNLDSESKRKALEKNIGETEISEITFKNLEQPDSPLDLTFHFENMDSVEEISGKLYFSPLVFMAIKDNPFKLEERQYPIDFEYPKKDRYIINITLPEGYQVESLPESIAMNLDRGEGSFKYAVSNRNGIIQLSVEFAINEAVIPSTSYGNLKKFYQLIIDKQNEKIVLSKT